MKINFLESSSILKKFLIFNFLAFSFLGVFTLLYLDAIKPNLIKNRSNQHLKIIKNTSDHIERLEVKFLKQEMNDFLLSTRFLFQNLDRVQFYDLNGLLIADTDTLDLDQSSFSPKSSIQETLINEYKTDTNTTKKKAKKNNTQTSDKIKKYFKEKDFQKPITFDKIINNNFFVITVNNVLINNNINGYIVVSELANDILVAVDERRNFILRTVFAITIVIFIFSIFLNKFILKPIGKLVLYTKAIKDKDNKKVQLENFLKRKDELGQLSRSLNEMTQDLYKRVNVAETFSSDLTHEIRNPLASLKGASEILDTTEDSNKRSKLLKIISHDVERIERLITDYSQMLKDEASLSRTKMEKINLSNVVHLVVEDFNNNIINKSKKIKIIVSEHSSDKIKPYVLGVESRLEQILANILDNSVSFSPNKGEIKVSCNVNKSKVHLSVEDEGPGFNETDINQVFKRFYSNRPEKFGEHSGLGLNIVKNIIELHGGSIQANNSAAKKGARIDIFLPIYTD
jgi:two-component system sensor histidine kinase ChvG